MLISIVSISNILRVAGLRIYCYLTKKYPEWRKY